MPDLSRRDFLRSSAGFALAAWLAPAAAARAIAAPAPAVVVPEISPVAMPVGSIVSYLGAQIPPGWMLCDGSPVKVRDYPNLYAAIEGFYGSSRRGRTFNLPDFRGRIQAVGGNDGVAVGKRDLHHHNYYGDRLPARYAPSPAVIIRAA